MAPATHPKFLHRCAAKAWTASLYHYLKQYPDIFMSPVKERCHFALEMRPRNFYSEISVNTQNAMDDLRAQLNNGLDVTVGAGIVEGCEDYLKLFKGVRGERASDGVATLANI